MSLGKHGFGCVLFDVVRSKNIPLWACCITRKGYFFITLGTKQWHNIITIAPLKPEFLYYFGTVSRSLPELSSYATDSYMIGIFAAYLPLLIIADRIISNKIIS